MTMMNLQSNLTGQGLADFAEGRIGTPYFYGAKISHGILTEEFVQELHEKLPDLVTDDYVERARQQGQVGKVNTDCSGLIGAYLGVELSSAQMYAVADQRIMYESYAWFPVGTVLWKPGHVGVYLGKRDGAYRCVEAKGINYGTICSDVSDNDWKCGLLFPWVNYDVESHIIDNTAEKFSITRKGENPYLRPCAWIMQPEEAAKHPETKKITHGEGVRWLQWELCEAGYPISVDGVFGSETKTALQKFQISCELCPDGIAKFEELEKISLSPGSFHV
nr:peptidoglycan-binding protein [uncultured Eubacterium sp.]